MRNDYDADAYLGRGRAYNGLHQDQEALDDLIEVLELDPDNADAYQSRRSAYQFLEDEASATCGG